MCWSVTGCAEPAADPVDGREPSGAEPVALSISHESRWRELRVEGTTDLPDGAVLSYRARLNTTYWPKGSVQVEVQFPIAPQPLAIRARYGDFGEELTGNNVTVLGASKVVTAEHAFDWTR
jgi:hypothetical protein